MNVQARHSSSSFRRLRALALALLAAPGVVAAQSAIIYGTVNNFDISNDTGKVCHGFEIQFEGLDRTQVYGGFTAQRYGAPAIVPNATGTAMRWESPYNASTGTYAERTLPHTVSWFPGQCYQWNPATYQNSGCEHFGAGIGAGTSQISARWLCEDATSPGHLIAENPPTAVPFPYYYVQPPAAPNNPPVLVAEVEAPEPPEAPELFGDAQWEQVYRVELPQEVTVDQLLADNPAVVPMAASQLESSYNLIQADPPRGGNGVRGRGLHRHQHAIDPTTRSVVRRVELYAYTGAYDPVTHEALCADGLCKTPAANEIGELLSVQMSAANVIPDAVLVSKVGSGSVDSTDKLISCGSHCAQSYNAGAAVTLNVKPASGSAFAGWTGACAAFGTQTRCTVTANGQVNVGAAFAAVSGGGGGGGGGGTQYTLSVGRSNPGTVVASPTGIDRTLNCGSVCSAKYNANTSVTLIATPPSGKDFLGWGGACSGTASTCTVTMTANLSVQANFSK